MIVIDGQGLAARSFFGTHYNRDSYSEPIFLSAFVKSLLSVLTDLCTFDDEVMFCLDAGSWRKKVFPTYKANRNGLKDRMFYKEYLAG